MTYFTFDYDEVVEFEGYYDSLYGSVTPAEKGHPCAPRRYYQLGKDVWKTREEATNALIEDCKKEFKKAQTRLTHVQN